ncbi:MAG: hypothetical protein M1608_06650 [Candidatus Omnitrophica bacterium]|nr:hypothetical protein [Candidatus Omnitrophota bacterium]
MSAIVILTPIVIAAWPAFSTAVMAAAASLGYTASEHERQKTAPDADINQLRRVELEIAQSELVTGSLRRDQRISVTQAGVTATFSRDARGHASLCVTGSGHTEEALRALGEELGHRVVQQYVYRRLMDELRARQFTVVEEEVEADHAIHIKVRQWEN